MRKLGLLSLLAVGTMFGLMLSGCNENDPTEPDPDKARVMFIHAGKDLAGVDVRFGGTMWAVNRTYTDFTPYIDTDPGSVTVRLLATGTSNVLVTKTFDLDEDRNYTLFAASDASGNPDLVLFTDDLTAPSAGKARVRVAHMLSDGPVLKVGIEHQGPQFTNIPFKDNTQTFKELTAGTFDFHVQNNAVGGGGSQNGAEPLVEAEVLLEAGKIYTLIIRGELGDGSAELVPLPHSMN